METPQVTLPKFGTPMLDGKYAGVLVDDDGAPYLLILLDSKPADQLTWAAAQGWAASLGAALPNRVEAAQLFRALEAELEADWHWTSESCSESYAWVCYFYYGSQDCTHKDDAYAARAVRRSPLQSFNPSIVSAEAASA